MQSRQPPCVGKAAGEVHGCPGESKSYSRPFPSQCLHQDRLREWNDNVNDKLQVFPCLAIQALDIDGIRVDKSIQVTVDGLARWSNGTRTCASRFGKNNFLIAGEVVDGNTFGSLYLSVTFREVYGVLKR